NAAGPTSCEEAMADVVGVDAAFALPPGIAAADALPAEPTPSAIPPASRVAANAVFFFMVSPVCSWGRASRDAKTRPLMYGATVGSSAFSALSTRYRCGRRADSELTERPTRADQ